MSFDGEPNEEDEMKADLRRKDGEPWVVLACSECKAGLFVNLVYPDGRIFGACFKCGHHDLLKG